MFSKKLVSKKLMTEGGEKMKKLGLALIAIAVLSTAVYSEAVNVVLWPGDNWMCAPLIPFNPDPASVFVDAGSNPFPIDYNISRLDPTTGGSITYDPFEDPPGASFGGVLLGDGIYTYNGDVQAFTIEYNGVPQSYLSDVWISLPGLQVDEYVDLPDGGGVHWVGNPFNSPVLTDSILVTDGTQTISLQDAVDAGWVEALWNGLDAEFGGSITVGPSSQFPSDDSLRPGHYYEVISHKDNIALIIPKPAE